MGWIIFTFFTGACLSFWGGWKLFHLDGEPAPKPAAPRPGSSFVMAGLAPDQMQAALVRGLSPAAQTRLIRQLYATHLDLWARLKESEKQHGQDMQDRQKALADLETRHVTRMAALRETHASHLQGLQASNIGTVKGLRLAQRAHLQRLASERLKLMETLRSPCAGYQSTLPSQPLSRR
jgi:hypothetical protein